jgi:hypothetical protein
MSQPRLLHWIEGSGWLVFSGGASEGSDVRSEALARAPSDGVAVYLSLADDRGDALMDDMEDLGAPTGYLVDLHHDDPAFVIRQLEEASIVVLEVGTSLDQLLTALRDPLVAALKAAFERGVVLLIEGLAINAFGRWMMSDSGEVLDGLNWVHDVFLEPSVVSASESRAVKDVLLAYPQAIAVEIGAGSALAVGADGRLEVWGERQVTISLGRYYTGG